jgi:hypothetical protein
MESDGMGMVVLWVCECCVDHIQGDATENSFISIHLDFFTATQMVAIQPTRLLCLLPSNIHD